MTLKYCVPPLAGMSVSDTPKGASSVTARMTGTKKGIHNVDTRLLIQPKIRLYYFALFDILRFYKKVY